jgi:hypothetical protein
VSVLQPQHVQQLQEELLWQHQHNTIKSYALGMRLSSWISKQMQPGYKLVAKGGLTAAPAQRAVSSARAGRVAQRLFRIQAAEGGLKISSSEADSSWHDSSGNVDEALDGSDAESTADGAAAPDTGRKTDRKQRRILPNRLLGDSSSSSSISRSNIWRRTSDDGNASSTSVPTGGRNIAALRSADRRRVRAHHRSAPNSALDTAAAAWKDPAIVRAIERTGRYIGRGRRKPGEASRVAAWLAAAAAAAGADAAPVYIWPSYVPQCLPTALKLDNVQLGQRERILRDIETGYEDLADTHVALSAVVPAAAAACRGAHLRLLQLPQLLHWLRLKHSQQQQLQQMCLQQKQQQQQDGQQQC